ncbi:hypothetical protein F511_31001 [Dorcoceras hygrometricum]|uniref:Uncharacterized protein n=1 Tax=Dorcoceras hygrometricum TaxID=472368 RepID=A0A2Z7CG89_9LAMI|nr:hypothetical protein F511_31001 [Dorcoceras hygrometricum]
MKLRPQKVLTSKLVQTYIKKKLEIEPAGESSNHNEDTASNTEGGESQGAQPVERAKAVNKKKMTTAEEPRKKKQNISTQPVEARSKTTPADSSSQLDLDSRPHGDKRKQGGTKMKKRVESSHSDSNISLPITHLVRRKRTQRPQTQQRSTGERDDPQHGSIPAVPIQGAGFLLKKTKLLAQDSMSKQTVNKMPRWVVFITMEIRGVRPSWILWIQMIMNQVVLRMNQNIQLRIARTFRTYMVSGINWETQFLPKIAPIDKGKKTMEVVARLHSVEEHCQLVLRSAWDNVSAETNIFDEWLHFCKETEEVSELLERRSLILYKLYELEVEKLYDEHLANFKLDVPSVNHDYLCIRRLNKELKEIATLHRAQRALVGLPIMDPEATFVGLVFNQPPVLALEFSSQAEQEQEADHASIQLTVQQDSEALKSQEHQAHENEPQDQADEHQALEDEHQAQCEHNYLDVQQEQQGSGGNPTPIADPSVHIVDIAINTGTHSFLDEHGTDHQDPSPSNLCMVTFTPDNEEDTQLSFLESSEYSHASSQRMFISTPLTVSSQFQAR